MKPDYGYQIGGEYKKAGSSYLLKGSVRQAQELFQKAVEYQPDLKASISQEAYALGEVFFKQGKYDAVDSKFLLAVEFDQSLNQQICDKYYELGQKADDNQCISFYLRAKKYSDTYNKEIGERLLAISKKQSSESDVQKWRKEAAQFVVVPPDVKEYPRGTYTFTLKAGEKTDLWIKLPRGTKYTIDSKDYQFKVQFTNGKVLNAWEPGKWNTNYGNFKIIAVKDQLKIILKIF